jgi:glutaredoxin
MITLYSKPNCEWCDKAKVLLKQHNVAFREFVLGEDVSISWIKDAFPTMRTVPIIVQNGVLLGGYESLSYKMIEEGEAFDKVLLNE